MPTSSKCLCLPLVWRDNNQKLNPKDIDNDHCLGLARHVRLDRCLRYNDSDDCELGLIQNSRKMK